MTTLAELLLVYNDLNGLQEFFSPEIVLKAKQSFSLTTEYAKFKVRLLQFQEFELLLRELKDFAEEKDFDKLFELCTYAVE